MLTTHEWASTDKLRRSYELFTRYVVPRFRGHTQGYWDQSARIQQNARERNANSDGSAELAAPGPRPAPPC